MTKLLGLFLVSTTALAIIGGAPATKGRFPSTVFLLNAGCTGSKIGARIFLSAKHCLVGGMEAGDVLRLQWRLKIDWAAPGFDAESAAPVILRVLTATDADLMVIEVDRDTPAIPVLPLETKKVDVGRKAYMNGYGCIDPKGMEIYDPVYFPYLQKYAVKAVDAIDDSSVVAPAYDFDGVAMSFGCKDDSGGPLYVESISGELRLAGVASSAGGFDPHGSTNYERVDEGSPGGKWLQSILWR